MSRLTVHVSPRGNAFMADIAAALGEAARLLGYDVSDVSSDLPADDGVLHLVVAPHEFFRLADAHVDELRAALARSVLVTTEQPGTPWFDYTLDLCRGARAVLDINPTAVDALRAAGILAHHLRLGAVPSMDVSSTLAARDIDVLFLGALDGRRAEILASLAPVLDWFHCELRLFPFDQPVRRGAAGLLFGVEKYGLLARSKVLLNLHRAGHDERRPYFEWARMVEAMANDCVVLTEPSVGFEPLVPGSHFVEADRASMADALVRLLQGESRRAEVASAARAAVFGDLALALALSDALESVNAEPLSRRSYRVPARAFDRSSPALRHPVFRPHLRLQRTAKALVRRHDRMLRDLDRIEVELRGGTAADVVTVSSPAWDGATADVSVAVTLYNYGHLVTEALDSVLASDGVRVEIIVVDDASTDDGHEVVLRHLGGHPDVPWTVISKVCNQGLPAARNTAFGVARCDAALVIDADNMVHPHGIAKLLGTLQASPDAAGAYGILEEFGEHTGLRSAFDWDVERLCAANYIDAQALVRRSAWADLGGYRDNDDEVYGWEDWDLWLRMTAAGRAMAFCPEIVGRYRTQTQSMVSLSNIAADDTRDAIRRRYPELPWRVTA